ncbi:MAG: glycosyltransferase, partial [Reyranella sp.]
MARADSFALIALVIPAARSVATNACAIDVEPATDGWERRKSATSQLGRTAELICTSSLRTPTIAFPRTAQRLRLSAAFGNLCTTRSCRAHYRESTMRILMVTNVYSPQVIGGAEIIVRRHARCLAELGHDVAIIAGWLPGFAGQEQELDVVDGLRVYRFPFRTWEQSEDFWIPAIEGFVDAVVAQECPDLVHAHNLRGLGVNLIAAVRRRGLPVFVTLHDHWFHCHWATRLRSDGTQCTDPRACDLGCCPGVVADGVPDKRLPVRLRRDTLLRALDGAHCLIAPSESLGRAYEQAGIVPRRLRIVSNGMDLDALPPMPVRRASASDGVVRFALAASLAEHKGIHDLIEATALLHGDPALRGRWQLTVAGTGQLQGDLEAAIASGRLGEGVNYVGQLDRADVHSLMAASDVVVLTSRWPENEPVVLLEGAAVGAALIATDVGGCPEMIHPGRSGELVPPRDPMALAGAMAAYVRAPALAALHGSWNADHRDRLDEAYTIAILLEQYAMAIKTPAPVAKRPPMVVCGGLPTPGTVSLVSRFHLVEPEGFRLRLLWQGWTHPEDWQEAAFYWDWGGRPEMRERALLAGLPV